MAQDNNFCNNQLLNAALQNAGSDAERGVPALGKLVFRTDTTTIQVCIALAPNPTSNGGGTWVDVGSITISDPLTLAGSGVSGFNGWSSAFWAEDPAWTPPANLGTVTSLRDAGSKASNFTGDAGTSTKAIYVAASANMNNKPVIRFDGSGGGGRSFASGTWATPIGSAAAVTLVAVVYPASISEHGIVSNSAAQSGLRIYSDNTSWAAGRGATFLTVATATIAPHILIADLTGAASFKVDNGTASTGSTGSQAIDSLIIGRHNRFSNYFWDGEIAFMGLYDGILPAIIKTGLVAWAAAHYGITL